MSPVTGGAALAQALADHGVERVWGIPGTHNLEIYAHLPSCGIRPTPVRHEQGAAFAADGFARATGGVGVCLTTSGPGVLNAATALAQAWSDSVPVLLVSAGMPLRHPGRGIGELHETKDLRAAMQGIVAHSHRVTSVSEIPTAVAQAFATMTAGRPRPVHLEVPLDVLEESAAVEPVAPLPRSVALPEAAALEAAARRLVGVERPVIIAGGGAAGASDLVRSCAEHLAAPVITTFNGKGCIASDHPLCIGTGLHQKAVRELVEESDAVFVVGSELAPADLWEGSLALQGKLVRSDIDPVAVITNAAPEVALVGDAGPVLENLLVMWERADTQRGAHRRDLHGERPRRWRERMTREAAQASDRWAHVLDPIGEVLGERGVLAGDSAMVCYRGAAVRLPAYRPRSFLYPTGFGTLGYGLPAAIGAKLGRPEDPVIVLIGDGGLMFTVAELAAAAQLGLALPVVVVDNGGYGEIRDEMVRRGDPPVAVELPTPDFAALAIALGCHGERVPDGDDEALARALHTALGANRPTLLHVRAA
jgi:acetolactate synthase-1/2/3 large subunit